MITTGTLRSRSLIAACSLFMAAAGVAADAPAQEGSEALAWPEVTREARPWTRWWWHGSAVDERNLTRELERMERAGLGGVEITPIYGVSGAEEQFIEYLTPRWLDVLGHTLREAERLDLGVDMATGNGWPFGGPWVTRDEASRYLAHRTFRLEGGERLQEPVALRQEPLLRAVGNQIYETHGEILAVPGQPAQGTREQPLQRPGARQIDIADLVDPVAQNENLQRLALDQVRFPRELPLERVVAFSSAGQSVDLTSRVDRSGRLDWTAPAGSWTIYALFTGWHGKQVERAGPGGEGEVIDHFSEEALETYLDRFDEAFAGRDLGSLRAFFNDSYEVDDASGEADWTPRFLEEFEERRGYDLAEHLPALLGGGDPDSAARVLRDYRQTIADLLLEEFTEEWREWASGHDALVRNQAHGSPGNILDLYAASDIPETEGTEIQRIRFASSAAHVAGRPLAAAEAATWLGEHFTSTLADVRRNVDRYLLGGVNHVVYHGTAYSPDEEPWPGRLFYAAVHFNDRNPWWTDFGALNRYVGRAQSFLQGGAPDERLLLYFPISDWYAQRTGDALLQHFSGMPGGPGAESHPFVRAAETLHERGFGYDFVSDAQLQTIDEEGGALQAPGARYHAVLVPRADHIPIETAERLLELARAGATVIAFGGLPEDVAGLADLDERRRRLAALGDALQFEASADGSFAVAPVGEGRVLLGEELEPMLAEAGVRREAMVDQGLQFIRRAYLDGSAYFVVNWGEEAIDGWVPVAAEARSAALFDPMTGRAGFARTRPAPAESGIEVYLQLQPGESRIVRTRQGAPAGAQWEYLRPTGAPVAIDGEWTLGFDAGGPALPVARRIDRLGSWTEIGGEDLRNFSGSATYGIDFERPEGAADAWILDLGTVHESARVRLNGEEIGTLIGPSFRLEIPADRLRERNRLEVTVTNLMANRIAAMDRQGVFWKKFYNVNFPSRLRENRGRNGLFDASAWEPRLSGLLGPVTITAAERF